MSLYFHQIKYSHQPKNRRTKQPIDYDYGCTVQLKESTALPPCTILFLILRRLKLPPNLFLALTSDGFPWNFAKQNSACIPCLLQRSPINFTTLQTSLLDGRHKSQSSSLPSNQSTQSIPLTTFFLPPNALLN